MSPQINQKKLINFCRERYIVVTAYCPLGRPIPAEKKPNFLYDEKLLAIGKKYNKTAAQVVFRYLVSGKHTNQHKFNSKLDFIFRKLNDFSRCFTLAGHWRSSDSKIGQQKTNRRKHSRFRFQIDR